MPRAIARDDAARDRAREIVGRKGVGVAAIDVARHLIEQDRRGERGVGVGQEGFGGLRSQGFVPAFGQIAHPGVEVGAAAVPVVHAVVVKPEGEELSGPVGGRRGGCFRIIRHCERSEAIQSGLCKLWIAAGLRPSQ
jgi:hypothetical protein